MSRDAIDGGGVDHCGHGASLEALFKRAEIFLSQVIDRNISGSSVLPRERSAVADKVLDADSGVLKVDVVGIVTLDGHCLRPCHLGLKIGIFSPAFPMPRPAGIPAKVHDRREYPSDLGGPGLVGQSLTHHPGIFPVEGGGKVDLLRVQGAVSKIRGSVNHVQPVNARDSDLFHRDILDLTDYRGSLLPGAGNILQKVKDRSHLVLSNDTGQFGRIKGGDGVISDRVD